jgi:hypothetical protein
MFEHRFRATTWWPPSHFPPPLHLEIWWPLNRFFSFKNLMCRNPSLGLATKIMACKGAGQEGSPGVTSHALESVGKCEGMNTQILKWVPIWELESRWTPKFSKNNFKGQNPLDWGVHYIIGKILERRCLKWFHMTHLDTSNTSYGQKKGWTIWLPTTKSRESPWSPCVQVTCDILLESSWWVLHLCFRPHFNQRSAH